MIPQNPQSVGVHHVADRRVQRLPQRSRGVDFFEYLDLGVSFDSARLARFGDAIRFQIDSRVIPKTGATRARPAIVTLQGLLLKSDSSYCLRPVGIRLCSGWMGDLNTALALVLIKRLL